MPKWSACACFFLFILLLNHVSGNFDISAVHEGNTTIPEAYVTLLYGDAYVLPIRVMMASLLRNSPDVASGLRERLVIVTKASERAVDQLKRDGIKIMRVEALDSPYTENAKFDTRFDSVMTKLKIFSLEEYRKVVFIDADSIVFDDMSPLFTCGELCAAFINPCYFNSGMMAITPNVTLYEDMVTKMKEMGSYDGGDQGFLNTYYPDMLDAPSFRPESGSAGGNIKRRLPFGWHVDHSSFYPRFSFDFSQKRCGKKRNAEFLGPSFAKPWFWWNYAVMDIPWQWHQYRRDLKDPYPPGTVTPLSLFWRLGLCYTVAYFLIKLGPSLAGYVIRKQAQYRYSEYNSGEYLRSFAIGKRSYLLIVVIIGFVEWLVSLLVTVFSIPPLLMPYHAIALYVHTKAVTMTTFLIAHGLLLSSPIVIKTEADALYHRSSGRKNRDIYGMIAECFLWGILDACFLPIGLKVIWLLKFQTMWSKIANALFAGTFHLWFVLAMYSRLSLRWVRVAAYWSKQELG